MRITVIIPAHSGAEQLGACLDGVAGSDRPPDQVIVVDDASPRSVVGLVESYGYEAVRHEGTPRGPAASRNRAAALALGDLLMMVDADVVVHPDAIGQIERVMHDQPGVAALFGSYDDRPAAPTIVSRYRNLLHYHTHQQGDPDAQTFWAGCGAIRKAAFDAIGGFSEGFARPSIEDIELGRRLRRSGYRIRLCPEIQATHLKRWSLWGMMKTDVFARAVPWTRLLLREERSGRELNLGNQERVSAVLAWLTLLLAVGGLFTPWLWLAAGATLGSWAWLNRGFLRLLRRRGGPGLLVGGAALHLLYYLYASTTFAVVTLGFHARRHALALLLLSVLVKGIAWSVVVPPLVPPDEIQHLIYAQAMGEQAGWSVPDPVPVRREVAELADRDAPGSAAQPKHGRKVTASPHATNRLAPGEAKQYQPHRMFYRYHPPLYFMIQGWLQDLAGGLSLTGRLLLSRWFSVAMAVLVTWLAWSGARMIWPRAPAAAMGLGILVGFHPTLTYHLSVMTNESLHIALASATLWLIVRVARRGLGPGLGATLGGVMLAGLLTKISFLAMYLTVGLALPLLGLIPTRLDRSHGRAVVGGVLAMGLPLLSMPWYLRLFRVNQTPILASYGNLDPAHGMSLSSYLLHNNWSHDFAVILSDYWGGQLGGGVTVNDPSIPSPIRLGLALLMGALFVFAACRLFAQARRGKASRFIWTTSVLILSSFAYLGFYFLLDFWMAHRINGYFVFRGQYFLAGVIGQMLCLMLGWSALPKSAVATRTGQIAIALMIPLQLFAFGLVIRHYGISWI